MNPSLAMLPCARATGKLYSVLPDTGAGDFTVSRNGSATFLGSNGLLQTAAANVPRLEFNTDGSFRGVLVEPSATNLLTRSEEFVTFWVTTNLNSLASQGLVPNGNNLATSVSTLVDSASVRHRIYPTASIAITSGVTYTGSYFLKKGNHRWVQLIFVNNTAFPGQAWANFDLETGTIGTVGSNATARIENWGNGWYRCSVTTTSIATVASTTGLEVLTTNNSNSVRYPSYQSTIAETVFFIWGAQLETGSVATSYIPTSASTVTRPADVITRTGAQDLIGQTEGTLFCEFNFSNFNAGVGKRLIGIADGISTLSRLGITLNPSTQQFNVILNSLIDLLPVNILVGRNKVALAYDSLGVYFSANGNSILTYSSNVNNIYNTIRLGVNEGSVSQLKDHINTFTLFKTRLSNAQLQALTTL